MSTREDLEQAMRQEFGDHMRISPELKLGWCIEWLCDRLDTKPNVAKTDAGWCPRCGRFWTVKCPYHDEGR
jgi:hypothetical protein